MWPYMGEIIAPIAIVICVMVIGIVYLVTTTKRRIAEASGVDRAYVEQLLQDILQDNVDIKTELTDIHEKVSSIEKMMKDV